MRTSDEILEEIQDLQREEDAIRERKRALGAELQTALLVEGKALPSLTRLDASDRAALRLLLAEADARAAAGAGKEH